MQNLLYDLRFALRQLRNSLGIAVLAILTLALGVGANTAIFTVIDNVLLRPLPYAHSDRLVFIGPNRDKPGFGTTSWLNYRDIRAQSKLLEDAAGFSEDSTVMESQDTSISLAAPRVTPNIFSHARAATPSSDTPFPRRTDSPAARSVVLLSERPVAADLPCRPGHRGEGGQTQRQALHRHRRHARQLHLS